VLLVTVCLLIVKNLLSQARGSAALC